VDEPNPWALLHEDAKAYITLATALLGVSATFASDLLSDDDLSRLAVFAGWALLVLAILSSVYASGRVVYKIRNPAKSGKSALVFVNIGIGLIVAGAVALAVGAWRTSEAKSPTSTPISTARSAIADLSQRPSSELTIDQLQTTSSGDTVVVVTDRNGHGATYAVVVTRDDNRVASIRNVGGHGAGRSPWPRPYAPHIRGTGPPGT
jgi:uncharacterized membrane protein YjfL (UPF0719 family)